MIKAVNTSADPIIYFYTVEKDHQSGSLTDYARWWIEQKGHRALRVEQVA